MRMILALALLAAGCSADKECIYCPGNDASARCDGAPVKDMIVKVDSRPPDKATADTGQSPFDGMVPDQPAKVDAPTVDGTAPGKGTPQNCTPDKRFCYGTQMRLCAASGKDSVLEGDCASSNIANVKYTCIACSTSSWGITCEADKPLITGSASGIVSFTYSYQPTCNPTSSASLYIGTGLYHSASPNGVLNSYPTLSIFAPDITKIPSGQPIPLIPPTGQQVTVTLIPSKGKSCGSYFFSNPPSGGTVTITHQGAQKGSTVTIKISGQLTCDLGQTWEAFTYNATGISQ